MTIVNDSKCHKLEHHSRVINYTPKAVNYTSWVVNYTLRVVNYTPTVVSCNPRVVNSTPTVIIGTVCFKNVNNYLNTNIYSYLETSCGQSLNLYLNVVHFFNTSVYYRTMEAICAIFKLHKVYLSFLDFHLISIFEMHLIALQSPWIT